MAEDGAAGAADGMQAGTPLSGHVKSWNGQKGYGFITCEEVEGDVMFSRHELPPDARGVSDKVLRGRQVQFEGQRGTDGRAKATLVSLFPVEGYPLPGEVKSYSERNGYGFITSSSLAEDVRFEAKNLPPLMPGMELKGQLVTFTYNQLADGKIRAAQMELQQSSSLVQPGGVGMGGVAGALGALAAQGGLSGLTPASYEALITGIAGMVAKGGPPVRGKGSYWPAAGPPRPRPGAGFGKGRGKASAAAPAAPTEGGSMTGQVKSFSERNGYGFITCADVAGDVKFGKADLAQGVPLEAGAMVNFVAVWLPDGRVQAKQVQRSQGGFGGQTRATPAPSAWRAPAPAAIRPAAVSEESMTGQVKSFSERNGYGFITCDDVAGDVKFGKTDLAQGVPLEVGAMVDFVPAVLPDGRVQAKQVQRSQGGFGGQKRPSPAPSAWGPATGPAALAAEPAAKRPRPAAPAAPAATPAATPTGWVPAGEASGMVKSFNTNKGLGFISCAGVDGDVAFFSKDLDPQVLPQVEPGVEVVFEMVQLPDGKLRAQGLRLSPC